MVELSADLFESTLRGLRGDTVHNRKHPRVPIRVKLTILPVENKVVGKSREVWTRDLCAAGIGLLSETEMAIGSQFIVRLPRPDQPALWLLCTVKICQEEPRGLYGIGASFLRVTQSGAAA